VEEFITIDP